MANHSLKPPWPNSHRVTTAGLSSVPKHHRYTVHPQEEPHSPASQFKIVQKVPAVVRPGADRDCASLQPLRKSCRPPFLTIRNNRRSPAALEDRLPRDPTVHSTKEYTKKGNRDRLATVLMSITKINGH